LKLAQVCANHPKDLGTIAGGLFAFKHGMDAGDTTGFSAVSGDVSAAVDDLNNASVGATSPNLPAMREFLAHLRDLSEFLSHPPKYPTAYLGDRDVALLTKVAKQAGCPLG
jgi:hypothetical protein